VRALKSVDAALTRTIARWRSKDMLSRNYFSHNIPQSGYNVFHVLDQKHYCYVVGRLRRETHRLEPYTTPTTFGDRRRPQLIMRPRVTARHPGQALGT
jgi:hypothetical protein